MTRSGRPHPQITYRWYQAETDAPPPMLGNLLASKRGRGAYRILGVRAGRIGTDERGEFQIHRLTVERISRAELDDPGAVVYGIAWDKREKRRHG